MQHDDARVAQAGGDLGFAPEPLVVAGLAEAAEAEGFERHLAGEVPLAGPPDPAAAADPDLLEDLEAAGELTGHPGVVGGLRTGVFGGGGGRGRAGADHRAEHAGRADAPPVLRRPAPGAGQGLALAGWRTGVHLRYPREPAGSVTP